MLTEQQSGCRKLPQSEIYTPTSINALGCQEVQNCTDKSELDPHATREDNPISGILHTTLPSRNHNQKAARTAGAEGEDEPVMARRFHGALAS